MRDAPVDWIVEVEGISQELIAAMNAAAAACLLLEGIHGEACGRILADDQIHALNRQMRGVDRATDVLSFPSIEYGEKTARTSISRLRREVNPETGRAFIGDFAIAIDFARRQAGEYGHSLKRELSYLTAHAICHLMGYDHEKEEDKRVMRALEERAMRSAGLSREDL